MKLAAFFEAVAPYLEGRIGHREATRALWGDGGDDDGGDGAVGGVDGQRLAIYARFCRLHRFEVLALYEVTREAVLALGGEAGWDRLVEDFFVAHPMRHFELCENGADFPAWLTGESAARGLPPWLGELADLEWWRWRAETGLDGSPLDPADTEALRIAPSVELRAYAHDLSGWLDAADPRPAAPLASDHVVLFWRDPDLEGRSAPVDPVELAVLKMVSEGLTPAALARATGLSMDAIKATVADLKEAAILVGELN